MNINGIMLPHFHKGSQKALNVYPLYLDRKIWPTFLAPAKVFESHLHHFIVFNIFKSKLSP